MMMALNSFEASVFTRTTRRNIPEDGILHSHCRENLNSYIALTGCILQRRRNVSPVKYEQVFYIPEDILPEIYFTQEIYYHKRAIFFRMGQIV
jgi:hypothetical protein